MNVESRGRDEHIAQHSKLWAVVFVALSSAFTLLLLNVEPETPFLGVFAGAGTTLYLFVAAKMNEWAATGDDHITSRPELWFGVWFVVSGVLALLELPTASGTIAGTPLFGLFFGAILTIGLFLVALLNRVIFSR
ncbi:hypothetical protein [Haladaptatus sp. DFWS20]|uniref:hypothetical protein n=1 Tax=Haladaptatus sp. DFWS20 TaxID=3403467 RepID=UPI003EBF8D04